MGGSAFSAVLGPSSFPRLPPAVYVALKNRLLPHLQGLYHFVTVPIEAPEKTSYGDVDFVVACPKTNGVENAALNAPHKEVQNTINAQYMNPMEGNRTSNFAIPIAVGEWGPLGHSRDEDEARLAVEGDEIFYQVDINVCSNKEEWDRVVFFHAYGDLGMILGLIAKNLGLVLGEKGLKCPNPPHPPIELSRSFDEIMEFMGLSMASWNTGFRTKREVFEWVGTSRFFDPRRFKSKGEGFRRVKPERKMYAEFVAWVMEKAATTDEGINQTLDEGLEKHSHVARDEALVYFNQKEAFDAVTGEHSRKLLLKQIFSGSKVRDWTGLGGYWVGVKKVMDAVREQVGGEEGILRAFDEAGEEGVKSIVLEIKEKLFGADSKRAVEKLALGMGTMLIE